MYQLLVYHEDMGGWLARTSSGRKWSVMGKLKNLVLYLNIKYRAFTNKILGKIYTNLSPNKESLQYKGNKHHLRLQSQDVSENDNII